MNSARYRLVTAMHALLVGVLPRFDAVFLRNPPLPLALRDLPGEALVFVLDRGDEAYAEAGRQPGDSTALSRVESRVARVVVGVYCRGERADERADQMHYAARCALRDWRAALDAESVNAKFVREAQVEPELKETEVDGTVLLSAFEIRYIETYQLE